MKKLSILVGLAFIFVGCAPNVDVGIPMGKYGTSDVSIGSSGNMGADIDANLGSTSVNTRI